MSSVRFAALQSLLNTSSFRQATTVAFICLLVSLGSIVLSNILLETIMRGHVRDMILEDVRNHQLRGGLQSTGDMLQMLQSRYADPLHRDQHVLLLDRNERPLYGEALLGRINPCHGGCSKRWLQSWISSADHSRHQLLGLVVRLHDGGHYVSAYDLSPMLERTRILPLMTGAGLFLVLLVILLLSLPFGLRNLVRISRINDALNRFAAGEREVRVPADPLGDEFDRMGAEVNRGLAQLNRLMEEVRSVSSHVAHELKTPLTRMQGHLLTAVEQVETGPARVTLERAVEESYYIQRLFKAVMRIAEVQTGRCQHQFESLDVRELVQDVADYYLPLAQERQCELCLDVTVERPFYGDRALLFQALANLIDNALKYTPTGTPLTLFAAQGDQWDRLGVADTGPGIDQSDVGRATERFERLGTHHEINGSGLGLTLVKAIAELHGGRLELLDNRPGLRAVLAIRAG